MQHISPHLKKQTSGEMLLDYANCMKHCVGLIICESGENDESDFALMKVAIDFYNKPAGFKFMAIMENWDQQRIVRELY